VIKQSSRNFWGQLVLAAMSVTSWWRIIASIARTAWTF